MAYKRQQCEAAVGNVSGCHYSDQFCALPDGSALYWTTDSITNCRYLPGPSTVRKYHDLHFVSDKGDIALTFIDHRLSGPESCNRTQLALSDQGLVVEFETQVEDLASTEADKVVDRVEGNEIIEQALSVV